MRLSVAPKGEAAVTLLGLLPNACRLRVQQGSCYNYGILAVGDFFEK